MVCITFEKKFEDGIFKARFTGHAGAAEPGKDIVCSAASILAYTIANTVSENKKMMENETEIKIDEKTPEVFVSCKAKSWFIPVVASMFFTVMGGGCTPRGKIPGLCQSGNSGNYLKFFCFRVRNFCFGFAKMAV